MTLSLLREELVEASVRRQLIALLPNYDITVHNEQENFSGPAPHVVFRDAFPTPEERESELACTTLAFGFGTDDGGRPGELGSSLTVYVHSITVWVYALEPRFGRHAAIALKHAARYGGGNWGIPDTIPLLDFNSNPQDPPVLDQLLVMSAQEAHQGNNSVKAWDKYVWTTTINVRDSAMMT